jgi:hypothetical protein
MTKNILLNGGAVLVLVVGLSAGAQGQVIYSWPGTGAPYWVPPAPGMRSYSVPTPGPNFYVFGYGVPPAYAPAVPYAYPYSPYGLQPYAYGYPSPYYLAPFPYGYQPAWPYPYVWRYRFPRSRPQADERWVTPRGQRNRPMQPPESQEPVTTVRGVR